MHCQACHLLGWGIRIPAYHCHQQVGPLKSCKGTNSFPGLEELDQPRRGGYTIGVATGYYPCFRGVESIGVDEKIRSHD